MERKLFINFNSKTFSLKILHDKIIDNIIYSNLEYDVSCFIELFVVDDSKVFVRNQSILIKLGYKEIWLPFDIYEYHYELESLYDFIDNNLKSKHKCLDTGEDITLSKMFCISIKQI